MLLLHLAMRACNPWGLLLIVSAVLTQTMATDQLDVHAEMRLVYARVSQYNAGLDGSKDARSVKVMCVCSSCKLQGDLLRRRGFITMYGCRKHHGHNTTLSDTLHYKTALTLDQLYRSFMLGLLDADGASIATPAAPAAAVAPVPAELLPRGHAPPMAGVPMVDADAEMEGPGPDHEEPPVLGHTAACNAAAEFLDGKHIDRAHAMHASRSHA
jgi:hypothetical protein